MKKIESVHFVAPTNPSPERFDRRERVFGTIANFFALKGFGFIRPDSGGRDHFLHVLQLDRANITTLFPGQRVSYFYEQNPKRDNKFRAMQIELEGEKIIPAPAKHAHWEWDRVVVTGLREQAGFAFTQLIKTKEEVFLHAKAIHDSGIVNIVKGIELEALVEPQFMPGRGAKQVATQVRVPSLHPQGPASPF